MRAGWLVVAACGGAAHAPAPQVEHAPAAPIVIGVRPLAPRPPLALADVLPGDTLPWPLAEAPSLAPHWEPARDACTDEWRAHHARDADALAYGAAWCRIRAQDRGAIDELGRLARASRGDLARAALLDAIDLAADMMAARRAIAWLDSQSLATPHALDVLAATYDANGQRGEARLVEERLAHDDPSPAPDVTCERELRAMRLDDGDIALRIHTLEATSACGNDRIWPVHCLVLQHDPNFTPCTHSFGNADVFRSRAEIVRFYERWSDDPLQLVDIERALRPHFDIPPVEEIAVTALENALRASQCQARILERVTADADLVRRADGHSPAFDTRLDALRPFVHELCDRRTTSTP